MKESWPVSLCCEVLNPQILPEDITGKAMELDVLARDRRGRLFNVEVQVQRFPRWSARCAYDLSRLPGSQIDAALAMNWLTAILSWTANVQTLRRSHHTDRRYLHVVFETARSSIFVNMNALLD